MSREVLGLEVAQAEREYLEKVVRSGLTPQREVQRARIVLGLASGLSQEAVAEQVGMSRQAVNRWAGRFRQEGVPGLQDRPGRGRKASLPEAAVAKVLQKVVRPPVTRNRWSTRSMAAHAGISPASVQRIWSRAGLKPHRERTFKLSNDLQFEAGFWDVIGLYLNPPDRALVLCCDEKSQCQALERTQPGLPLGQGHIQTRTHDYYRHGTVTLFAALNTLDGTLLHRYAARHRHQEWLAFLRQIEREAPAGLDLHLIQDNYATHKHPKVKAWLARHPRIHIHMTPTGSSWLNLVERFFADLTSDVIRPGSFTSVRDLCNPIEIYMGERNLAPVPYKWTASGEAILGKIHRARTAQQRNTICKAED